MRRAGQAGDPEARGSIARALRIRERVQGAQDPAYARTLQELGLLLYASGDFPGATGALERAFAIQEAKLGPNHIDLSLTLLSIAAVKMDMGELTPARPLIERALRIREVVLGPDHEDVAVCLNTFGALLERTGEFASARTMYLRALRIWENAPGAEQLKIGDCLHNLGTLEILTSDFEAAERHLERALQILERSVGREHPLVARTLTALAGALRAEGNPEGALKLLRRALGIQRKLLGPRNSETIWTSTRIAFVLIEEGKYSDARALLSTALDDLEKDLGPTHPDVAEVQVALAITLGAPRDSSASNRLFRKAIETQRLALGNSHPEIAISLGEFARNLAAFGDYPQALTCALQAEDIAREDLRIAARTLTERQALGYAALRAPGYAAPRPPALWYALSLLEHVDRRTPEQVQLVWDAAIRSRTLVLDEVAARNRMVGEVSRYAGALDVARQRLANLLVRGPSGEDPEMYRSTVDQARADADEAEHALAGQSSAFRLDQARSAVGWREVQSSLPPGAALIAYSVGGEYRDRAYFAFVLRGGAGTPSFFPLGPAKGIDDLIRTWQREVGRGASLDGIAPRSAERKYRDVAQALRRRIWDPIAPSLEGTTRLFIVPDGAVDLVSFAALPSGSDRYLIEQGRTIHYLSAERDLVPPPIPRRKGDGLLAVGGASFNDAPAIAMAPAGGRATLRGSSTDTSRVDRGSGLDCDDFSSIRFGALPQSVREVEEVDSIWAGPGIVLTGIDASEAAVRRDAPGRRIVHLATHGFFLTGRCASGEGGRGIGGLASGADPGRSPIADSPFLLSGLAFAGANQRSTAGLNERDGILTAEEISTLDLSGVEWVVLSGCDTGVGEVRAGEGVLGLRRAFRVAGAGTLIMSLWPVEDEATRTWMRTLYLVRFRERLGTAEAVQTASVTALRARRAQALSTHPFYWAAFVATGDWK